MMEYYSKTMRWINQIEIFGFIPLDLLLHVIVGFILVLICQKLKLSRPKTFLLLVIIAGGKEVYDYNFHWRADWTEYASDFAFTFTAFIFSYALYFVRGLIRKRKESSSKPALQLYKD